jgi:GNAT superfamily N-acetyltransferase
VQDEFRADIQLAGRRELDAVLAVQREAFGRVARELGIQPDDLPPLCETLSDINTLFDAGVRFWVARVGSSVVGSVRAHQSGTTVEFGRLVVARSCLRRGIASRLMLVAEKSFPDASRFTLFTGEDAIAPLTLYARLGYAPVRTETLRGVRLVWLEKSTGAFNV